MNAKISLVMAGLVCLLLTGCETTSYYYQAIAGQLNILTARQPIAELLENPDTPPEKKEAFRYIQRVLAFAGTQLKLPAAGHYTTFVELNRPYVVWNVFAAGEFEIEPKTWCFPIAGCVAYRGYFDQQAALDYQQQLQQQKLDTYVGGVAAYSTLGWFDDPILSTFLNRSKLRLTSLLFHELAHQKLYIQNDSAFNEGFATAVEMIGMQRWLARSQDEKSLKHYLEGFERRKDFTKLILKHRQLRKQLYQSSLGDDLKRQKKAQLIAQLREDYQELKHQWGGFDGYDAWFQGPLNNAQLSTIATYNELLEGFLALYLQQNRSLDQFYQACEQLKELDQSSRHKELQALGAHFEINSLYFSVSH